MFNIDGVRRFHHWTHATLNLLLDHVSTLPSSEYARELSSFGFRTLREQAIHIFNCEGFWVCTLQGFRYTDRTVEQCRSVAEVRLLQQEVSRATDVYLSKLSDLQLNADAELHFPDGDVAVRTPALVLHHVLTHAFHHKGQMVAMCRALGHPAPDTDLNQIE